LNCWPGAMPAARSIGMNICRSEAIYSASRACPPLLKKDGREPFIRARLSRERCRARGGDGTEITA
jgi:hypothetical protein